MIPLPRPKGDESTHSIIGAFYEVYSELGYGLLEKLYSRAFAIELRMRGHVVEQEKWVDVFYKGHHIGRQRVDMLVDHAVVVENKSTEWLPPYARRQALNYLRAAKLELALVFHFGPEPKFHRVVNTCSIKRHSRAGEFRVDRDDATERE